MNEIIILENNIVLIGTVKEIENGIKIYKPYSIQRSSEGFQLQPFLEMFTGQNWNEVEIKNSSILTKGKAENNELLQGYLQKISGIEVKHPKIITS